MSIDTPKFYKTSGINRFRLGLWDAFGKGLSEDNDGNILFDYIEVLGYRSGTTPHRVDWTSYGRSILTSLEESRFEEVQDYWDVDGNPDYINNVDRLDEMKSINRDEIVYIAENSVSGEISLEVSQGPLIINTDDTFSLQIYSAADGNLYPISTAAVSFTDYCASAIDRIGELKKKLFILDLGYAGYTLQAGDIIFCSYTFFHHTDMTRDNNDDTQWESGVTPDTSIEIEFFADTDQVAPINHIELTSVKKNYPTGAKEYIIQAVEESFGSQYYRVVKAGYLPQTKQNEIDVIKFDLRYVKKLKVILIGSANRAYVSMDVLQNDPGISTISDVDDFSNISVVPIYTSPNNPNTSFVTGESVLVADMATFTNGGTIYVPQYYNGSNTTYIDYILAYMNIYYNGILVYKGVPNPFLNTNSILNTKEISDFEFGVCPSTMYTADVYNLFDRDYLSINSVGNESLFYTRFRNINASKFSLYRVDSDGNETVLTYGVHFLLDNSSGIVTLTEGNELAANESLYCMYTYLLAKLGTGDNYDYVDILRLFGLRDAIRYSSIHVYPQQYFLEYLPNKDYQIFEFEYNPSSWDDQVESNQQLIKVLGGGYRKQKFGNSKAKFTIKGEKISDDMYNTLKYWEQETSVLGLVDDMLQIHKGYVVPGSLQGARRRTNKEEEENETTSWSWSLTFQEV